jgi:hypothetical protein
MYCKKLLIFFLAFLRKKLQADKKESTYILWAICSVEAHNCGGEGAVSVWRERAMAQWNGVTVWGSKERVSSWRTAEMRPLAAASERERATIL